MNQLMKRSLSIVLVILLAPSVSLAVKKPILSKSSHILKLNKGLKIIKQGNFAKLKAVKVSLEDGQQLSVPQLASKVFAVQVLSDKKLKRAFDKKILFKAPVIEEHAAESKDIVTLTRSTTYVVSNPTLFAKEFSSQVQFGIDGKALVKGDIPMAKVMADKDQKAWFTALKKEVLTKSKSHPLRVALKKGGNAGLVAAALNGVGDITVTDSYILPKVAKLPSGAIQKVIIGSDGRATLKTETASKIVKVQLPLKPEKIGAVKLKLNETETKEIKGATNKGGFLTGFTRVKGWEKRKSIGGSFLKATFRVNYGYAFGLRVPLHVTWKVDPALALTKSNNRKGQDKDTDVNVTLTAKPAEKGKSFYEKRGLSSSKVFGGKEIFMGAWASATATFKVGGKTVFSKTKGLTRKKAEKCIKTGKGPCFSREMQPPWGSGQPLKLGKKRSQLKYADVWVPADLTKSKISGSIVVASGYAKAEVGLRFGGANSKITMNYRPIIDGKKKKKQTLTFKPGKDRLVKKLKVSKIKSIKAGKKSAHKYYGFELSKPRYKTTITATPGIKLSAGGKWAWQKSYSTIKPYKAFFSSAKIKLFTTALGPHDGTKTSIDCTRCGVKQYILK